MKLRRLTFAGCMLVLLATATAQLGDCDLNELFADSGSALENLMADALRSGDNPTVADITVHRNHTVCESVGLTRGKVSSVSLVIDYNCTSSGACPSGGRVTEQFDFGCNSQGEWVFDQFFDVDNGRTRNPLANFDTELRTDCGACFPVHPDTENPRTIDPITHCHVCECGGGAAVGQNACFDTGIGACCNVYVNNRCAESCPSEGTYVIEPDTFVCIQLCEDLGNTAVGGSVTYTQSRIEGGYPVGSVASVICTTGYTGGGDITCQNGNWTGSLPRCSVVDCGSPPSLENGKVMSLTGTTFESTVTYECDENYLFADDDVKSRTCLASGSWSDEDIRCDLDVCGHTSPCQSWEVCTNTGPNGHRCSCLVGYEGMNCSTLTEDSSSNTLVLAVAIGSAVGGLLVIILLLFISVIAVLVVLRKSHTMTSAHGTGDSIKMKSSPVYGAHTAGPSDSSVEMNTNPVYGVQTQQSIEYYMNEGLGPSDPPLEYEYIPAEDAGSVTNPLLLSPSSVATADIPTADNVAYGVATQVT